MVDEQKLIKGLNELKQYTAETFVNGFEDEILCVSLGAVENLVEKLSKENKGNYFPFKPGDTLYHVVHIEDSPFPDDPFYDIVEMVVKKIEINQKGTIVSNNNGHHVDINDFGKTVFLDKKKAETVMNERNKDNKKEERSWIYEMF